MKKLAIAIASIFPVTEVPAQNLIPELNMVWSSSADTSEELSSQLEALYLTLYNSGNLTVQEVRVTNSPFAERIMRDEGLFFGAFFPETLDAMLCDLNPKLCRRTLIAASVRDLANANSHVGGYKASLGRWRTELGDTLIVPDYRFKEITKLSRVEVPGDWTIADFKAAPAMDCTAWKADCLGVVARFNPPLINAPSEGLQVTLPQLQVETQVSLRSDDASELTRKLSGLSSITSEEQRFVDITSGYTADWIQQNTGQSLNDLALETLRDNLRSVGTFKEFSVEGEPLLGEQVDLFKLINHPFAELEALDEIHTNPVDVVVIDRAVTKGHCDLPPMMLTDGRVINPTQPETDAEQPIELAGSDLARDDDVAGPVGLMANVAAELCARIDSLGLGLDEHAAAIAGVIASPANGRGMVGVNPYARLHMVSFDRSLQRDVQIERLAQQIMTDIPEGVRVANLSFGVLPDFQGSDEIENALQVHGSRVLLVAAAGNENQQLTDRCPIIPACLNGLENVITVIGLNDSLDDPSVWRTDAQGSNTSAMFEIGAPAENILTTIDGNAFARRDGTSFAAPQVTAAASLIFSTGEFIYGDDPIVMAAGGQIAPRIVKDRLIYTADFHTGLNGYLMAGRLNVRRAIALQVAQFELFDGRRIAGQVINAPDQFVCRSPQTGQQFQSWWNIRRMTFNQAKEQHILFRHTGNEVGSRYGTLERDPSCLVATLSAEVEVRTFVDGSPQVIKFTFGDIRDYTSPLFQG